MNSSAPLDRASVRQALLAVKGTSDAARRHDCAAWVVEKLGDAGRDVWLEWATTWESPDAPAAVALWEAHAAARRAAAQAIDNARKRSRLVP